MPRVSVVIPAYNAEAFIAEAIESVLEQTFRDFELIVVNDGSTDSTGEIIERYSERVRCIHQQNRGPSEARNRGIRETDSEFVAFLDADDTWRADKLQKQVATAQGEPELGLVYSDAVLIDQEGTPIGAFRRRPPRADALEYMLLYNPVVMSTAFVRRECFQRVGMFHPEPTGCEDWHMWIRIASAYKLAHIPEPLCNYRSHTASMAHNPELMCHGMVRALDLVFAEPAIRSRTEHIKNKAYARARLNCGIGYFRAGRMAEARRHLLAAIRLNPAIVLEAALIGTFIKSLLGARGAEYGRSLKRLLGRILRGRD